MVATEPASAIVVRAPVPREVERLGARWDWAASVGVPAHVTVLFPFVSAERLGSEVRRELASIAAAHEPLEVRFARVGRSSSGFRTTCRTAEPSMRSYRI
jgi:hypothetical protein